MTLKQFIRKFDFKGSVVLLEGKRDVNEKDTEKLISLGSLLAAKTKHILFRSGNARGADYYFSLGVAEVNPERLQTVIHYSNHRRKDNKAYSTISLDDINRDTVKIIGTKKINSANFGIFYDDLDNPMSGGTGHTINICKHNNIDFINQLVWFSWLN